MTKVFTYIKESSSRIPSKNFKPLGSKELWRHLIDKLLNYELYIDTDSEKLIEKINQEPRYDKIISYKRKKEFIDQENDMENKLSPALDMIDNFIDQYVEDDEEIIVNTHVTSPFLTEKTIDKAINKLKEGYEFVHSVSVIQDFAWLSNSLNPINFNPKVIQRTQDLEKIFVSNGAFFIFRKKDFKKYNNRLGKKNFLFELNSIESVEIDDYDDWLLAERVINGFA